MVQFKRPQRSRAKIFNSFISWSLVRTNRREQGKRVRKMRERGPSCKLTFPFSFLFCPMHLTSSRGSPVFFNCINAQIKSDTPSDIVPFLFWKWTSFSHLIVVPALPRRPSFTPLEELTSFSRALAIVFPLLTEEEMWSVTLENT